MSGRVMGTPNVYAIYWVLNKNAEHCDSCVYLRDHGPYHRYNIPTTPGAGQTQCLGNCKCRLMMVKMNPNVLQPFLKRSKSKDWHLRKKRVMYVNDYRGLEIGSKATRLAGRLSTDGSPRV